MFGGAGPALLRRVLRLLSVLVAVSFSTFLLLDLLPGGPVVALLGNGAADPRLRHQLTVQLGLDHPFLYRYGLWVWHLLHGDLGFSYITNLPVSTMIAQRAPVTVELVLFAFVMAVVTSVTLAVACARRPHGWLDRIVGSSNVVFLALPPFMLGTILDLLLTVKVHAFPSTGVSRWFSIGSGVVATPASIFLPALTMALGLIPFFAKPLRAELTTTLRSDYIDAARGRGLGEWHILFRHALRPSSLSLLTLSGLVVGNLITSTVLVESIFAISGLGGLMVESIFRRDYLVVQAVVLLSATVFVVSNVVVDSLYGVLDPRIRHAGPIAA